MTERDSQELANRVSEKLQAFYDALPDEERPILQALLTQAAEAREVTGHKVNVQDFNFVMRVDKASPLLFLNVALGGPDTTGRAGWDIAANKKV